MSELDNGDAADTDDTELDDVAVPLVTDPADWQEQQLEVPDTDPDDQR